MWPSPQAATPPLLELDEPPLLEVEVELDPLLLVELALDDVLLEDELLVPPQGPEQEPT
jgi:hypothetical protein